MVTMSRSPCHIVIQKYGAHIEEALWGSQERIGVLDGALARRGSTYVLKCSRARKTRTVLKYGTDVGVEVVGHGRGDRQEPEGLCR